MFWYSVRSRNHNTTMQIKSILGVAQGLGGVSGGLKSATTCICSGKGDKNPNQAGEQRLLITPATPLFVLPSVSRQLGFAIDTLYVQMALGAGCLEELVFCVRSSRMVSSKNTR